jgi:hypothetical protein
LGRAEGGFVELVSRALPELGDVDSWLSDAPLGPAPLFDRGAPDVGEPEEFVAASTVTMAFMNGCMEQK